MAFFQAAYVLLWALLIGYLYYLGQRQRQVERELERVRQSLAERSAGSDGDSPGTY
ncbi:CcmD family protein [Carboxydochorda subterranea]|uniref:CcmD family protein n=1 Tax=Carboxydichorda subterranea TaxID=3109565 RepID=A0ABZ1BY82_9FIRM|nr:CcmD family protein [Limnochorda sp. L945t]WRP17769.1 CcmD family protein [Limnochorda sp. L945t]